VRELLAGLPARDRELLTAYYIESQEKPAICARLSLSPSQFDVIKFRALRRFRLLWEARYESVTEP
jgi:DNA-directed RNA polymerase specialized sigma24 family protein